MSTEDMLLAIHSSNGWQPASGTQWALFGRLKRNGLARNSQELTSAGTEWLRRHGLRLCVECSRFLRANKIGRLPRHAIPSRTGAPLAGTVCAGAGRVVA